MLLTRIFYVLESEATPLSGCLAISGDLFRTLHSLARPPFSASGTGYKPRYVAKCSCFSPTSTAYLPRVDTDVTIITQELS